MGPLRSLGQVVKLGTKRHEADEHTTLGHLLAIIHEAHGSKVRARVPDEAVAHGVGAGADAAEEQVVAPGLDADAVGAAAHVDRHVVLLRVGVVRLGRRLHLHTPRVLRAQVVLDRAIAVRAVGVVRRELVVGVGVGVVCGHGDVEARARVHGS